jgi:geranylgeranylglycerol-phosphate geranylgeranyltransferase
MAGIAATARACAELIRIDLAFGAGFFLVAGQVLALGTFPPAGMALAGFCMLFFISGSANISNDYFDRDVDRVNLPGRPLPSGRITIGGLVALFVACSAIGFLAAAYFGPFVFVLVLILWALSLFYNVKLKEHGIIGNLTVAFCVGMTIITGGITAGAVNGIVLVFGVLAFLFDLGEEIASDAMDLEGDDRRPSQSLAKILGRQNALYAAGAVFAAFFLVTLLPFVVGWLGLLYLAPALFIDLWMVRCAITLVRNPSVEVGRVQVKRLYLSWGGFVILLVALILLVPAS